MQRENVLYTPIEYKLTTEEFIDQSINLKVKVVVRQESSFKRQLLMHKMCYATEKMGVGPPDSHYRM